MTLSATQTLDMGYGTFPTRVELPASRFHGEGVFRPFILRSYFVFRARDGGGKRGESKECVCACARPQCARREVTRSFLVDGLRRFGFGSTRFNDY